MKKLESIKEKTFNKNIKLIEKYAHKSLREYYKDSRLYLNTKKINRISKEIEKLILIKSKQILHKDAEYFTNECKYYKENYENKAIVLGINDCYAYNFEDCTFNGCTFYLVNCDSNFIFENCSINECNIRYVSSIKDKLSLSHQLWRHNIKGLIHIALSFTDTQITNMSYWYGEIDQAVVSIYSQNSKIKGLNVHANRIKFLDTYEPETTFFNCSFFGDIITMTMINKKLIFADCNFMIFELNQIEYRELNEVLEVINKMIEMEHDDKREDTLKILYDALYSSDSYLQTWLGIIFGFLRLPKVIIRNAVILIIIFAIIYMVIGIENDGVVKYTLSISGEPLTLIKNFLNSFIESLYFSCCTFTTVGYGDYQVNSRLSIFKIIPICQMILGYIFSGVMIGSFYHKVSSRQYIGSNH